MFSDTFLAQRGPSSHSQEQVPPRKSPLKSYEDWKELEGLAEWPCTSQSEAPTAFDADTVLGSLDGIKQDLQTHSPWGGVFLDGVEKKLEELEMRVGWLAEKFLYGSTTRESGPGGLSAPTFLTELCEPSRVSCRSPARARETGTDDCKTVHEVAFPGINAGCTAVPLPGSLKPLPLLHLATKTTPLPSQIKNSWTKIFKSDASCSLLQNTFWYVWLSYFKTKPDSEDIARLFTLISENFMTLLHIMDKKHKDEIFNHLPEYLARAVYSAFCHAFPKSSKTFNSEEFLSFLTNLTSKWITGVASPLGSWKRWPRGLLDPHLNLESDDSETKETVKHSVSQTFTERNVTRLSVRSIKPRSVQLCTHSASLQRRKSPHSAAQYRARIPTNTAKDEGVGVGVGPTFECVQFGLTARSPLLQNYLVIHGLEEAGTGEVLRRVGPVIGRTQISKLPPPSLSYKEVLKTSHETTKQNYDHFEKTLARSEQEICAARKKHNALLRASDRRTERLLQHKFEVAIMAERIMNKYASKLAPLKPAPTEKKEENAEQ